MSKYSGKADFYDVINIWGIDTILECEVVVNDKVIEAKSINDFKPYFGTLISGMSINKEKNEAGKYDRIVLCNKPYYKQREDEIREIYKGDERIINERIEQLEEFYGKYFSK